MNSAAAACLCVRRFHYRSFLSFWTIKMSVRFRSSVSFLSLLLLPPSSFGEMTLVVIWRPSSSETNRTRNNRPARRRRRQRIYSKASLGNFSGSYKRHRTDGTDGSDKTSKITIKSIFWVWNNGFMSFLATTEHIWPPQNISGNHIRVLWCKLCLVLYTPIDRNCNRWYPLSNNTMKSLTKGHCLISGYWVVHQKVILYHQGRHSLYSYKNIIRILLPVSIARLFSIQQDISENYWAIFQFY